MMKRHMVRFKYSAFTLIEVLIVVVIIGLLAAIVVAKFVDAGDEAQESAVKTQLQTLRSQIGFYYFNESAYPLDLDTLRTEGYISSPPDHPGDGNWVYDNTSGELLSSVDNTW